MKKLINFVLAVSIILSSVTAFASGYKTSDWAEKEIAQADMMDIIPEILSGGDLTKDITRKEFAMVSVKTLEYIGGSMLPVPSVNPFKDIDDKEILKAYGAGITTGISDDEFAPDALLNREQAATMLTRVIKKCANKNWTIADDSKFKLNYTKGDDFADDTDISDWAKDSIYFMSSKNVINGIGDNKFGPKGNASREQAIAIAERMVVSRAYKLTEEPKATEAPEATTAPEATIAPDATATPEPTPNEDEFLVVALGESTTESGGWIRSFRIMLQEKMPDKKVVIKNAGKGGTGSNYGIARFQEDAGQYNPDMIIVETTINDRYYSESETKTYMEGILRQCASLVKVPYVLNLNAPMPVEMSDPIYTQWKSVVDWKDEVCAHYGVKSIDIYDYMQRDFKNLKSSKKYNSFTDYLAEIYQKSGTGFDVHGGYGKYYEAIEEAFKEDYEGFMTKPKDVDIFYNVGVKEINATYSQVYVDNERLTLSPDWVIYTNNNKCGGTGNSAISAKYYRYPYFEYGIAQIENKSGTIEFKTSASEISLNHISTLGGCDAKVYVDGKEAGQITVYSKFDGINYITNWVKVADDGKEHSVKIVTAAPSGDKTVFRFGSIIEKYYH